MSAIKQEPMSNFGENGSGTSMQDGRQSGGGKAKKTFKVISRTLHISCALSGPRLRHSIRGPVGVGTDKFGCSKT